MKSDISIVLVLQILGVNTKMIKITGETTYKAKINIPEAVRDFIIPIFSHEDLASDDHLSKCLHGQTQNVNESFNQCIWKKVPKDTFVGKRTLQIGVASATMHFNDGARGLLNLFGKCSIEPLTLYSHMLCEV